jgi:hypothetical protein
MEIEMETSENENENYQLFVPYTSLYQMPENRTMTIDTIIYNINNNFVNNYNPEKEKEITKEELEIIHKKKTLVNLSNIIEKYLIKNPKKMYNLTKYTLFVIDEIQAEIFISTEMDDEKGSELYYYKIISKNIYYELDDDDSISEENVKDLVIYDNYGFYNILSLLEDIKYVESNFKILDYYLLSPEHMVEALAQREFIPIHPDKICSVCYDPTIEFTSCKHSICLKCREKCIVQGKKTCPICRNSNLCIYPVTS